MSAYKRNAANRRLVLLITSIWIVLTHGKEVRLETCYLTKQIQPWVMRGIIIIIIITITITITITIMKTITIMIMINALFKLYIQIYQQHNALRTLSEIYRLPSPRLQIVVYITEPE